MRNLILAHGHPDRLLGNIGGSKPNILPHKFKTVADAIYLWVSACKKTNRVNLQSADHFMRLNGVTRWLCLSSQKSPNPSGRVPIPRGDPLRKGFRIG